MAKKNISTYVYDGVKKNVRDNSYFTDYTPTIPKMPKDTLIFILSGMKMGLKMSGTTARDFKVLAFNMLTPDEQNIVKSESAEFYQKTVDGKCVNKNREKADKNDAHLILQYLK